MNLQAIRTVWVAVGSVLTLLGVFGAVPQLGVFFTKEGTEIFFETLGFVIAAFQYFRAEIHRFRSLSVTPLSYSKFYWIPFYLG